MSGGDYLGPEGQGFDPFRIATCFARESKKIFACFSSFPVQNIQNIEEKICSRR